MSFVLRSPLLVNCLKTRQVVVLTNLGRQSLLGNVRQIGNNTRSTGGRTGRVFARQTGIAEKPTRSLKEILMQPTSGMPFSIGAGAVAGGSILGLGALCYYGLGLSKTAGTYENSLLVPTLSLFYFPNEFMYLFSAWPQYVRDRIKSTYFYFGSGLAITAASAAAAFRSPVVMNLMTRNSMVVS